MDSDKYKEFPPLPSRPRPKPTEAHEPRTNIPSPPADGFSGWKTETNITPVPTVATEKITTVDPRVQTGAEPKNEADSSEAMETTTTVDLNARNITADPSKAIKPHPNVALRVQQCGNFNQTLFDKLRGKKSSGTGQDSRIRIMIQILHGLKHLEELKMTGDNLKLSTKNIRISANGCAVITDGSADKGTYYDLFKEIMNHADKKKTFLEGHWPEDHDIGVKFLDFLTSGNKSPLMILRHPLFWSASKKIEFFTSTYTLCKADSKMRFRISGYKNRNISKAESQQRKVTSQQYKTLEIYGYELEHLNKIKHYPASMEAFQLLFKTMAVDETDFGILSFIRHCYVHQGTSPKLDEEKDGKSQIIIPIFTSDEYFWKFFSSRFPDLFMTIYKNVFQSPKIYENFAGFKARFEEEICKNVL